MDTYFDTILEDESPDEVGNLVWDLSRKWLSGDKESVGNYILSLNKVPVKHHVKSRSVSDTVEEMVKFVFDLIVKVPFLQIF